MFFDQPQQDSKLQPKQDPKLKVYLAAEPDVLGLGGKQSVLNELGHQCLLRSSTKKETSDLMHSAEVILVNITQSINTGFGTAFEMGCLAGETAFYPGKALVIGYYNDDDRKKVPHGEFLIHLESLIHQTGGQIFDDFETAAEQIQSLWAQKQQAAVDATIVRGPGQ